jgi:hypothetical protein
LRFYDSDGLEIDVQDPKFFIDEEELKIKKDSIEEILLQIKTSNPMEPSHFNLCYSL